MHSLQTLYLRVTRRVTTWMVSYITGCEFQIPQNARRLINL